MVRTTWNSPSRPLFDIMELLQPRGALPPELAAEAGLDPALLDSAETSQGVPPELMAFMQAQLEQQQLGDLSAADMMAMLIDYLINHRPEETRSPPRDLGRLRPSGSRAPVIRGSGPSWTGNPGGSFSSGSSPAPASTGSPAVTATPELPPGEGLDGLKIKVIGDSLMEGAQGSTRDALTRAGAGSVDIDASGGRAINGSGAGHHMSPTEIRQEVEASGANVVVLELGSNHSNYAQLVPETMNELSKIEPPPQVVWVNTQTQRPSVSSYGQDYFDQNAAINQVLAAEAAKRPNMVIADWSQIAGQPGINAGDGLHLTSRGNDQMAKLILDSIASLR